MIVTLLGKFYSLEKDQWLFLNLGIPTLPEDLKQQKRNYILKQQRNDIN